MTIPQQLRKIADAIDGAEHCTRASQLRGIARDLESSCEDLLTQASALDRFFGQPPLEQAGLVGRMVGAVRSATTRLVGFDVAHERSAV